MKKMMFIIFLIYILSNFVLSNETFNNLIYEDKSLYIVVLVGSHKGKLDYTLPTTKICKLQSTSKGKYIVKDIQIFDTYDNFEHDLVKSYNKYGFICMVFTDLSSYDQIYYELNIIPMNKPWIKINYSKVNVINIFEDIFPLKIGNKIWLALYNYKVNPNIIKLFNINTRQSMEITSEPMKTILLEGDLLTINNNKLTLKRAGLGEFTLPFSPPPLSILEDIKRLKVILDSEKFLVASSLYHLIATNQRNKEQALFILDKQKKIWNKYQVKGTESSIYPLDDYIVCRIANISPKGINYPPVSTGEWMIIDLNNNITYEIKLSPASEIFYIDDRCIIARNDEKLLYIPLINGKYNINNSTILYQDSQDKIGTPDEVVNYIAAVFWGPKEIDER